VSAKPFPVAKQSLAAAQAALALGGRAAASTLRVHVPEAYAEMVASAPLTESRLSRIASVRRNIALALARPPELHDIERTAAVDDPELSGIAGSVEVVADPELSRLYPRRWPARVEAGAASETVVDAAGDPPADNGFATVDAKWRDRPEDVRDLRTAALAGDAARLAALLRLDDTIANHGSGTRP
jgi:2-methylcitrate dehydratase PrpD